MLQWLTMTINRQILLATKSLHINAMKTDKLYIKMMLKLATIYISVNVSCIKM